jgi:biotin carboxyl carrier protein
MIKKLRVTVDGKSFDVTVEIPEESAAPPVSQPPPPTPAPEPVRAAPAPPPAAPAPVPAAAAGPGEVPSPLAGRVIAIIVQPGQDVKENDHILTIEAMKMNTFVFAPKAGKVAEIKVSVGDAVAEGQVLTRIQ